MSATCSPESLIELGYELFLKQAADHLAAEAIVDITLEFDDRGAVDAIPPSPDWRETLDGIFVSEDWYEIVIGLLDEQDEFEIIYCRMLLPVDGDMAKARLRWINPTAE